MPNMTCAVTGEVSDDNFRLVGGKLILSPEGAEMLVKEIQNNLKKINDLVFNIPKLGDPYNVHVRPFTF